MKNPKQLKKPTIKQRLFAMAKIKIPIESFYEIVDASVKRSRLLPMFSGHQAKQRKRDSVSRKKQASDEK